MTRHLETMEKYLIITADDMGYNRERNSGIVECFQRSGVTNSSIMVNGVACQDAALQATQAKLPTGLHFNITEGVPVQAGSTYSTLTGKNGHFLDVNDLRAAAADGTIDTNEVATELKRQVERYVELMHTKPVYVDGHKHGHMFPGIVDTFCRTLKELGIRATRLPREVDQDQATWNHDPWRDSLFTVSQQAFQVAPVLQQHGIWTSDCFYGLMTMGRNMTPQRLQTGILKAFASLGETSPDRPITCELMTHPGFACQGEEGGCGDGADDFSKSSDREYEKDILEGEDMQHFYEAKGIHVVPYDKCLEML